MLAVRGILHDFNPFSRGCHDTNSLRKVVVVEHRDITMVVTHGHMLMELIKCDGSSLLMSREVAES